jgi:hypothetical protein
MMMSGRAITYFVLLGVICCGCTTTQYLSSPLDANHGPITDQAVIMLRSGERIEAVAITVGLDTTQYALIGSDSIRHINTIEIERLRVTDYFAGTVGGFFGGMVGGFVGGMIISKIAGTPQSGEGAMGNIVYAAGGIIVGSISGSVYGGARGYRHNYIFPRDSVKTGIGAKTNE